MVSFNLVKWSKSPILASSLLSSASVGSSRYLLATVIFQTLPFGIVDWDPVPSGVTDPGYGPVLPSCKQPGSQVVPIKCLFRSTPHSQPWHSSLSKGTSFDLTQELSSPLRMKSGPKSLPGYWVLLPWSGLKWELLASVPSVDLPGLKLCLWFGASLIGSRHILNPFPHSIPLICSPGGSCFP